MIGNGLRSLLRRAPHASLAGLLLVAGCGGATATSTPDAGWTHNATGPLVTVSGAAFVFGPNADNLKLDGATIRVVEAPELTTTVDADGKFSMQVPSGGECSFVLHQDGFHDMQTATLPIGASGLDQIGFQVPSQKAFNLLAGLANIVIDDAQCQIATTVSRAGTSPYGGDALGEPDTTVAITPPLTPDNGPIYFAYANNGVIYPDPKLTATSIDGGVIFANVPPGEYHLVATKSGKKFTSPKLRCRAGLLVNAAPPKGIQEE